MLVLIVGAGFGAALLPALRAYQMSLADGMTVQLVSSSVGSCRGYCDWSVRDVPHAAPASSFYGHLWSTMEATSRRCPAWDRIAAGQFRYGGLAGYASIPGAIETSARFEWVLRAT